MTKKEIQLADRGFAIHEELLNLKKSAVVHFYRLGELMREVRDGKLWKALGHKSFEAYFGSPELGFERSSVYRAIKTVHRFKLTEVERIPVRKIFLILPHITSKNKEKLLEMAESLSSSDLIHQLGPGKEPEKPSKFGSIPKIYRCNTCGGIRGLSFDTLCHCGWTSKQIEAVSKAIEKIEFGG